MLFCGSFQGPKCTVFAISPLKPVQFPRKFRRIYKLKDHDTGVLFPELFPFGDRLDERNRWLQIANLIPWAELKGEYLRHSSRLGLLLLKHMTRLSDLGCS